MQLHIVIVYHHIPLGPVRSLPFSDRACAYNSNSVTIFVIHTTILYTLDHVFR